MRVVVAQFADLRRAAGGAYELGLSHRRPFALAMSGAHALARRAVGGLLARSMPSAAGGSCGLGFVALVFASARYRRRRRRVVARARFLEDRHADHADIARPPGAGRVAVAQVGEHELGDVVQRLAPAGDLGAFPGFEHVAGLRGRGGFAGDGIDAVHRQHHQHAFAGGIGQAHAVAVAGRAGDPGIAAMRVFGAATGRCRGRRPTPPTSGLAESGEQALVSSSASDIRTVLRNMVVLLAVGTGGQRASIGNGVGGVIAGGRVNLRSAFDRRQRSSE